MTPGRAILLAREWLRGGVRATYFRERVAPRILLTPPIPDTTDGRCEIHALTCAADWLGCMWALKTFYWHSGRSYRLCIHEDGTVSPADQETLRRHFPAARLITRARADARAAELLAPYPRTQEFRRQNVLAPKLIDFHAFLESDRLLSMDSDVLFFGPPTALIERIERSSPLLNAWNADCGDSYTVRPEDVERELGFRLLPRINAGLGVVHRDSIRLEWLEEFLGLAEVSRGHFWRVEQTLYALCSSRFGAELLPVEYSLRLEPGIGGRPFRHYVGAIRDLLYAEGISHAVSQGLLGTATPPELRLARRCMRARSK